MVLNKKYRLFLAFGLALFIHFMMMNMEITKGPVILPDFHIPRSVNVFLGQTSQPQNITDIKEIIEPVMEQVTAESEQEQVVIKKNKTPVLPIDKKPAPIIRAVKIPNIKKTLSKKDTAVDPPESMTAIDAQLSNVSKKEVDTGQKHIGVIRMARPMYRVNPPPVYPKLARKRGYEGTVVLQVLVNKQGRVDNLQIDLSSNHTMLDRAALNSVRKWHFEPGRRGNEKIDVWVKVPVTFTLKK